MNKKKILSQIIDNLMSDTDTSVTTSAEIEFYFEGKDAETDNKCILASLAQINGRGIENHGIYPESGERQYEIILKKSDSPIKTAENTEEVKNILFNEAKKLGLTAVFHPKPYDDQPGSGLHIHVSLLKDGKSLYSNHGKEEESEELMQSIGGLCTLMTQSMPFFAPNDYSYNRFTHKIDDHVPSNVSWGGNNRTVAIRIPTSTAFPEERHIEHRIAGVDSDPFMVISAILLGIKFGISNKIPAPARIHGNAFDRQYSLEPLPRNLDEAKKAYKEGAYIKRYL